MNLREIEKFIDDRINLKFNSLEGLIDEKIKNKFSLSIRYWYPTLFTVIIATGSGVLWFKSQLKPIDEATSQLKVQIATLKEGFDGLQNSKIPDLNGIDPVVKIKYVRGLSTNGNFTKEQIKTMEDLVYTLNNERKDLVIIIAGFTCDDSTCSKGDLVSKSNIAAKNVADFFLQHGVDRERIFYKGHGPEVPEYFDKRKPLNTCLMLCDIFTLMQKRVKG